MTDATPIRTIADEFELFAGHLHILKNTADGAVEVKDEDLANSMLRHAECYLHWARLAAHADTWYRRLTEHKERVLAECCLKIRRNLEEQGTKATEAKVGELAKTLPLYLAAQEDCTDAYEIRQHLRAVEAAMLQRKDMLQSINSRRNREHDAYSYRDAESSLQDLSQERSDQLANKLKGHADVDEC